jgi:hypothetical protein
MKVITILIACLLLISLTANVAFAAQWTGWVTDRQCAETGKFTGAQHRKCLESGQALVFVSEADNKIYKIENHEKAKDYVGQKVVLEASAKGEAIDIAMISPKQD